VKLKHLEVNEFRSVFASGKIEVGDVTCLVGKNEAGKTALLKALYRLNPIVDRDGSFDVTDDYPRKEVGNYRHEVEAETREEAVPITATFELEDADVEAVAEVFGEKALKRRTLTLTKNYSNGRTFILSFDEGAARQHLANSGEFPEGLQDQLRAAKSWPEFKSTLDGAEQTAEVTRTKKLVDAFAKNDASSHAYNTLLRDRVPKFLYFDDYYQMRGHENVQALMQRQKENKLEGPDYPLLGLISLARLKLEDLLNTQRTVELNNLLEGAGNHLSKQILKYWSQNKHLRMKFDVREARPQDPPHMRQGQNIWGQVVDTVHWATTELGSRSRGFVWFFSFLAWYEDVKREQRDIILLLDEPGLSLHGRAQADLLRYVETELKPHHQVLYTTHSPFMVDSQHFDRVRIVQDKGIDADEPLERSEDGTKVISQVFDASDDSLFPLQGALGYDLHQSLFVGPNCLVVEGPADLLFLKGMSSLLERAGGEGLSEKWTITPVGGGGKVGAFVALLAPQRGMRVATLLDVQPSDQAAIDALYKRKLLERKRVLTYADFVRASAADVEDMFDRAFYVSLVNAEYAQSLSKPIGLSDLNSNIPRVVRAVEDHLKKNPMKSGEYGHFRPARYFSENLATLEPDIDAATRERFAAAIAKLNGLLR